MDAATKGLRHAALFAQRGKGQQGKHVRMRWMLMQPGNAGAVLNCCIGSMEALVKCNDPLTQDTLRRLTSGTDGPLLQGFVSVAASVLHVCRGASHAPRGWPPSSKQRQTGQLF